MTNEEDKLAEEMVETKQNQEIQKAIMSSQYQPQIEATTDRTKEIEFVNKLRPQSKEPLFNQAGEIVGYRLIEGEAPIEAFEEYPTLLSPQVSLTNIKNRGDEEELYWLMKVIQMDVRLKHPRSWFNAERNSIEDQVEFSTNIRIKMSRDNQERQNTITYAHHETKGFQVIKSKAKDFIKRSAEGEP